jgi:hypothetical protein
LDRHCVDGDVDATLVAATEAHVDSENTTTTAGAAASESSSAVSDDSASMASTSTTVSHAALVLSACFLAFTAYIY